MPRIGLGLEGLHLREAHPKYRVSSDLFASSAAGTSTYSF